MTIKDSISETAAKGKAKTSEMSAKAKAGYDAAKTKAASGAASAKQSASNAYGKTREKSAAIYESGKAKADAGYQRGRQQFDSTPLAVMAGGLALGALVAALIPETEREKRTLGTTGKKINDRAKGAVDAAKTRGSEKIDDLGLSTDALKKQAEELLTKGVEIVQAAVKAAGKAAADKD